MAPEVFLGKKVKSEKWSDFCPEDIVKSVCDGELFWDIVRESVISHDWGCWIIKFSKNNLIAFLNREKYKKNSAAKDLLKTARTLGEAKDYFLAAVEVEFYNPD